MLSRIQVRDALKQIAQNNNLTGDAVDLIIDQLAYSLYHEQLEITNAVQESNLSTARLLSSKIRQCMNVMYSVYRGRNCRVKLNFQTDIKLSYNKFDVLYNSNTFKVYAQDNFTINPDVVNGDSYHTVIGLLSTKDLYDTTINVTKTNQYYIDLIIDRVILADISEDIQVFIDGTEYQVTRNFHDFIQQALYFDNYDAYQVGEYYYYAYNGEWLQVEADDNGNIDLSKYYILGTVDKIDELPSLDNLKRDKLFALTLPEYGVRLYKRNYFKVSSEVRIRALYYTTMDEINEDEFSKIFIPGTVNIEQVPIKNALGEVNWVVDYEHKGCKISKSNIVSTQDTIIDKVRIYNDAGIIPEIDKDNERSLLQNANYYSRVQGKILSRSDINILFVEYFRDIVKSATNWYLDGSDKGTIETTDLAFRDGNVVIYYIPINEREVISDNSFKSFKKRYSSYFISNNLIQMSAVQVDVNVSLVLYLNSQVSLDSELESIFDNYAGRMNDCDLNYDFNGYAKNDYRYRTGGSLDDNVSNVFKYREIYSKINKLSDVAYIDSFILTDCSYNGNTINLYKRVNENDESEFEVQLLPPPYINDTYNLDLLNKINMKVPTFYKFNLTISYKLTYDLDS